MTQEEIDKLNNSNLRYFFVHQINTIMDTFLTEEKNFSKIKIAINNINNYHFFGKDKNFKVLDLAFKNFCKTLEENLIEYFKD